VQIPASSGDQSKSIPARYALALLASLAGLLLREMLSPFLGASNPYHAAWAAVAFSAWYCGIGPTILTAFISMFGVWYWFLPVYHSFALQDPKTEIPGMIGFVLLSGFIAVLGEVNLRSKARLQQEIAERLRAEKELERERSAVESRIEERTQQLNNTIKQLNIQAAERLRAQLSLSALSARLLQLQDEERRRIARELHDSAGQTLVALDIQLSIIQMKTQNLDGFLTAAVADSVSLVQEASCGIRTMSYLLHPPLLDEAGLVSPLQWFVEGFAERSGIQVELTISQKFGRLPREMELTLFRIVQEALTNVHRHSGSPTAQVELNRNETDVTLLIRDQGKGTSKSGLDQSNRETYKIGVGIRGMRERVHQLGGKMEFLSGEPGTILEVTLPLHLIHEVNTFQYSDAATRTTPLPAIGYGRD
jgi:signal transduction histidine kinase